MKTKEIYNLHDRVLPTIPVPHDCVIKNIRLEHDRLIFVFEDDISYYDSIKSIRPQTKSLIMKFQLLCDKDDVRLFILSKPNRLLHKPSVYKEMDMTKGNILEKLCKNRLEYLYHNVGFNSVIIKLASQLYGGSVVLDIDAENVEFEWIY